MIAEKRLPEPPLPAAPPASAGAAQPLASEGVVLQSPLSYSGSARRIWRALTGETEGVPRWALGALAALLTGLAWILVTFWYALSLLVFGVLLLPWRMWRHHRRAEKKRDLQHRELMDATKRPGR